MYIIMCKHNKFLNNGLIEAYETVYSYKTTVKIIFLYFLGYPTLARNRWEMGGTGRRARCN